MKTVAIEINHVIRNINYQIYKYYKKEFDESIDLDEVDDEINPFDEVCKFVSTRQKNNFLYVDYPLEIYGLAKEVERNLQTKVNSFLSDFDEDVNVIYYSLYDDDALSIQSTYFFLSKIACRVKNVVFVKNPDDIWKYTDAIITSNGHYFTNEAPEGKKVFRINRKSNAEIDNSSSVVGQYDNLSTLLSDSENFIELLNKEAN